MVISARTVVLLPLLFGSVLSKGKECEFNSEANTIKPFYATSRPSIANSLPCTYKLANIKCGVHEAVVIARNSLNDEGGAYLSDVIVNVTSQLKDGSTRQQISKLDMSEFIQTANKGKTKSMWNWSSDADKKLSKKERLDAKQNKKDKSTTISLGKLAVKVRVAGRTVAISCNDDMAGLEDLSQTLCGGPEDSEAAENAWATGLERELRLWDHHKGGNRGDYWFLTKHRVQQTNPLCEEASNLVRAGQCSPFLGELSTHLHDCRDLAFSRCVASTDLDPFQVYVTCLRVLCGPNGPTPNDTCNMLNQAKAACTGSSLQHADVDAILADTDCPAESTDSSSSSSSGSQDYKLEGDECTDSSECGPNADCSLGKCACKEGFTSDHGRCGRAVGDDCDSVDDCVSNTVCKYFMCMCQPDYMINHDDSLCYKKVGQTCSADEECMKDAVCAGGKCACSSGRQPGGSKGYSFQPELYCYLKLGESCQSTDDCGVNAECDGSPKVCGCPTGFDVEDGRCAKAVGAKCDSSSECVTGAYCSGKCRCDYGYQASGAFCTKQESCEYSTGKQGTVVSRFDAMESEFFDPLPCRYKMADVQCGAEHAVVTLDNSAKNGVVSISNVTLSVTTVGADGSTASQSHTLSPESSTEKTAGSVSVSLTDKGKTLTITCNSLNFYAHQTYPRTFCGGPLQSGAAGQDVAASGLQVDSHHEADIENDIVALVTQDVQQSDSLCQEASSIASSKCRNMPRLMHEVRSAQNWCLQKYRKEVNHLEYYVAAMRAVCGTSGAMNPDLDTCDTILQAAGYCGYGEQNRVTMNDFLEVANCGTSFVPTTVATSPRDYYGADWK